MRCFAVNWGWVGVKVLATIRVKNFALVEDCELQLHEGFTVFTGETGAGKSLLLHAILLLLGNRASASWVRKGADRAEVEGQFFLGADEERLRKLSEMGFEIEDAQDCLVVRREFGSSEKSASRIWIQGKAATRSQLQMALSDLIEVSGQHEFLRLNKSQYILEVLDSLSEKPEQAKLYRDLYQQYKIFETDLAHLKNVNITAESLEFLRSEVTELGGLAAAENLEDLEQDLETKAKEISSKEKILEHLDACSKILQGDLESGAGLSDLLRALDKEVSKLSQLSPLDEVSRKIELASEQIGEVDTSLTYLQNKLNDESLNTDEILEKLSQLRRAKRKYNVQTAAELNELVIRRGQELKAAEEVGAKIEFLLDRIGSLKLDLEAKARKLSYSRKTAAEKLVTRWEKGVRELGMPHAAFSLKLQLADSLGPYGQDNLELFFSSNRGHELMPLAKVASGGELSRILLSLKGLLSGKAPVGVYLFDEVDTGIGGETAHIVGKKLAQLAKSSQVLVVTHLAQIAAFADAQVKVEKFEDGKNSTRTVLKTLIKSEKVEELARMLGGHKMASAKKLAEDLVRRVRSEIP